MAVGVSFLVVGILSVIANFILVYSVNHGATIISYGDQVINEEFYVKVFMNPLFHFGSFFYGICLGLVYIRFRKERGGDANSKSSRLFEFMWHNQGPRYAMYVFAILLMTAAVLWQTPFLGPETIWTGRFFQALYASFAFPMYLIGLSMILMSAFAGKAQAFRWLFGSQTWTMLS